ncbi:DUF1062 domain-containing protein [Gorillibacterium massiliense]|uniref:DUF1062 domain-containing protein n=1 Tax=Gorillibacterium massiliense TaxID=1280390 RepID=UPI00059474CD|nr:DUF1062 domain-containing protein [Gorillibacterium massiliense]
MILSRKYRVEIIALETPKVLNKCHRCKKSTEFYCSEKFRGNAQQKSIDIWLIYKCVHCDSTWNYPILSRVHTNSMDKVLHQKFMNNDRETAWEYAFQMDQLCKACSEVNTNIEYTLKIETVEHKENNIKIILFSKYKFDLRLDKLLKEILDVSRSKLYQMADSSSIITSPQVSMNSKIKEDLLITVTAID